MKNRKVLNYFIAIKYTIISYDLYLNLKIHNFYYVIKNEKTKSSNGFFSVKILKELK